MRKKQVLLFLSGILSTLALLAILGIGIPKLLQYYTLLEHTFPDVVAQGNETAQKIETLQSQIPDIYNTLTLLREQLVAQGKHLQEALNQLEATQLQYQNLENSIAEQDPIAIRKQLHNMQISLQGLAATQKSHAEYLGAILGALPDEMLSPPEIPVAPQPQPARPSQPLPIPDSF